MSDPKVSVIVPVFNGEDVLAECLDSLLGQSMADIEIIVIDDGSVDGTGDVCAKYAVLDGRVVHLRQENGGVSSARNAGLGVARGEYLAFADADDVVPVQGIESLLLTARAKEADLVVGDYLVMSSEENRLVRVVRCESSREFICSILDGSNHSALWNKLVKRSTLGALRFQSDIRYAEDQILFVEFLLSRQVRIAFVDSPVYMHRLSADSATRGGGSVMFDLLRVKLHVGQMLVREGVQQAFGKCFESGSKRAVISIVAGVDTSLSAEVREQLIRYSKSIGLLGFPLAGLTQARALVALARLPEWAWSLSLRTARSFRARAG